ncbi:flagellar motor protein MotB [uncultured Pseudoflavonifractor sp.]|uniref:OmpA/MotB family protein n=1 Tax=uncultured Pseudoflavonifractor sp. TaxID=1221379 RepID=UPI0025E6E65E|nr:flagellar motor protein MotB [uncultured Pseudoflavonifractor sp.]
MKKKHSGGGGANWMDTYGDMVTLLLCFFVMLYSMSNLDKEKWIALVQAFNPSATVEESATSQGSMASQNAQGLTQAQVDADIETLYEFMQNYVQQSGLNGQISVTKGNGYVFVSFDNTVFFDGNSYTLRDDGKAILDQVAQSISEVSESIDEIRVLGHTAQEVEDEPNNPTADRFLASNRAAVVTIYLQEKNVIDPARLVSVGYGQWRPISDNDTSQGRAQNRRVELLITGLNIENSMEDDITQYYTIRSGEDAALGGTEGTAGTSDGQTQPQTGSDQEG